MQATGAGDDCPAPDILAAYFERSLDANETAHVELHLSECARCREQLAALGRAEEAAAAPIVQAPRHQPRASWLWDWRWLAPVAAVLVIAAVWATRRPEFTRIAEHPEQAPATAATSLPTQQPVQHADQQPAQQDKKQLSSRVATPAPSAAPASPAPAANFTAGVGVGASAENSRSTNAVAPTSASPDELSKKAAQQEGATDQASKAPAVTSETLTVQPESSPIASIAPEAASPHSNGAVGGVAGGASGAPSAKAQTAKEKEAPALVSAFRARPEIITENQAGELSAAHIIPTSDSKIMWRIASGGFVERSNDGGLTWNGTLPKQNAHYAAGSAPSAKVCWLAGNDGIILLTQDAANWQTIPPPVQTNFVAIAARDAWTATVTTADGRKFTTTNQGESWTPAK